MTVVVITWDTHKREVKLGLRVDCDRLLLGQERMTPDLAAKLGGVLGGSTAFWLARDEQYMRALRRLAENVEGRKR